MKGELTPAKSLPPFHARKHGERNPVNLDQVSGAEIPFLRNNVGR